MLLCIVHKLFVNKMLRKL